MSSATGTNTVLQDWHNGTATVFTERVVRILDGVLRAAAEQKPPVKKAGEVPFQQGWASILFKRTFRSLRSFAFFIKERSVLCVLLRSL